MSPVVLRSAVRPKRGVTRPAERASVREVCLLGTNEPRWTAGERVSRLGRTYRVEAAQPPSDGAAGYTHLSCLDAG
jgi:hypothetical protein